MTLNMWTSLGLILVPFLWVSIISVDGKSLLGNAKHPTLTFNDLRPFIKESQNKIPENNVENENVNITIENGVDAPKYLPISTRNLLNTTFSKDGIALQNLFHETFRKGESDWLDRHRSIEHLFLRNEAVDPKSPLGTVFAFHAPNSESLWISNTSILLEFTSRALIGILQNENTTLMNSLGRPKRQSNFLQNDFWNEDTLGRVDITPFVPAQDYLAKCGVKEETSRCDPSKPYRSYSGWCNNIQNPNWGKSVTPFDRMLPPVYDDGISTPKQRSVTGRSLPSPRYVSSTIHIDVSNLSHQHTLLFMQYAQFLDHDITFTPVNKGPQDTILNCRECDSARAVHPECWPIPVPANDNYYPAHTAYGPGGKGYCIAFTRSLAGQQRLGPREQINQNSAYIDSSQIYGENYCKSMSLRNTGGMLNVTNNADTGGRILMPQITKMSACRSPSGYCFHAGDSRASEQPGLSAVHTIYLREHNRIAGELRRINPNWHHERLYQETRRIFSAVNQHIAYNEFLPRLLGSTIINAYGLGLQNDGYYAGYDPNCSPNVYNEFATSAFRFGHSLIRPNFARMDNRYNGMINYIPLRDGFFNSDMFYKSLMVDEIIRGLLTEPMEQMDPFITKEITNHLFEDSKRSFSGMDLISLNLHRGRDHGLQGYNAYRVACGLSRAVQFQDLQNEVPLDVIARLQTVYESVNDIDLFTGSMVERAVSGGILGPTMGCIIGNQFKKLRQCDRFWYETNDPILKFTPVQLAEIRKATLSKIICNNFDVSSDIQKNAFDAPHNILNPRLPCNRLPQMRFEAWREKPASTSPSRKCNIGNRQVELGESGLTSPCVSCICTYEGAKCSSLRITNCQRLMQEASLNDIMNDENCTSQCGHWLGINTTNQEPNFIDYNLQSFQPPQPFVQFQPPQPITAFQPPHPPFYSTTNRFNVQATHNLFTLINDRSLEI